MKRARIILGILCLITILGGIGYIYEKRQNLDTEAPVLQAKADTIKADIQATDAELMHGITAEDNMDGDVSDTVLIESIIKKEDGVANEFWITYVAFDEANNSGTLTRTLFYEDYRQPHYVLEQPLRFPENKPLSLLDYFQAEDCLDGDISPFITLEGGTDILREAPQKGFYDITLSVTNSVGDTAELPMQVEIYEDSYEIQTFQPEIVLNQYIVYIKQGEEFFADRYLEQIKDKGIKLIDSRSEEEYSWEEDNSKIHISKIGMESNVDVNVSGIYSVVYSYTSDETGYGCNTRLIVVVE